MRISPSEWTARMKQSAPASVNSRSVADTWRCADVTDSTACPYCGKPRSPRPSAVTCGDADCKRLHVNAKQREWTAAHPGYRQRYAKYPNGPKYAKVCTVCGSDYRTHKADSPYCSVECMAVGLKGIPPSRRAVAASRLRMAAIGRKGSGSWHEGPCAECGVRFIARRSHFCSTACARRAKERTKRARHRAVERRPYSRHSIFERDGWRCKLCGKRVRRTVDVLHPLAPTIDHIIPLAAQGADAPENVQCAHRLCNSIKSDKGGGQTLLFG